MTEDADPTSDTTPAKRAIPRWRRWLYRLISVVVVPLILLSAIEGGLRLFGYGYNPDFFLRVPGRDAYASNPRFTWTYFPPAIGCEPEPVYVPATKGANVFRVFVVGGSAAQGVPDPSFNFSRILEVMLADAFPDKDIEVHNVAITAINSHVNLPIVRACAALEP
ncbi:MAG: tetratricopeptide repeat protein, partial [Planctomycetota bacterium]